MGQKVVPTGFRLGITEEWKSKWYSAKAEYGKLVLEDFRIRAFLRKRTELAAVSNISIERTRDQVLVCLHTSRPGLIIGRKGTEIDRLRGELEHLTGRRMDLKIIELTDPLRSAVLISNDIANQLEKRGSFRRVIKRSLDQVMEAGVDGVKIEVSGRLGGAEMSRNEKAIRGSIPLSTLRKRIDYGFTMAKTTMGVIGVKVWIDLGDSTISGDQHGVNAETGKASQRTKRPRKR